MESNGEWQMKLRSLARLPFTSCCAVQFLTGGGGNPCHIGTVFTLLVGGHAASVQIPVVAEKLNNTKGTDFIVIGQFQLLGSSCL